MNVRIENEHGQVLFQSVFSDDALMDPQEVIQEFLGSDADVVEVSWQEECNGLYEYRVLFYDDIENPDHTVVTGGFIVAQEDY